MMESAGQAALNAINDSFWGVIRQRLPDAHPLGKNPEAWDEAFAGLSYQPVSHLRSMVSYQIAYVLSSVKEYHDLSLVLHHAGRPVGIWPLGMMLSSEGWRCSSYGGPVLPPRFVGTLSEKLVKKHIAACHETIETLCQQTRAGSWKGIQTVFQDGVDIWHRRIMEKGATVTLSHELYVDLGMTKEKLKSNVRKSYKSLVSEGRKLWNVTLFDHISHDVFSEFRELHRHIAGRVTRSAETWDLQELAINEGHAFLVALRNETGRLVGSGLFYVTRDEGMYAVGAYDRELFHEPLGHVVQATAIDHMQDRGLRWYKIGDRPYPGDVSAPNDKELSIGYFKEGFCTHMFLKLHTTCAVVTGSDREMQ